MPIQNGKYVNPGWVDNSPPAIDAAELNAISETLENLDAGGGGTSYTDGDGISIQGTEISVALSSQAGNRTTFGTDGGVYTPPYTEGNGISVSGNQIAARLSTQADNAATFGTDGGLYVPKTGGGGGSGKRYARLVIGTSTAGWTAADCDYLCDGVNDQWEFEDAVNALPSTGGEIVVLDGTYIMGASFNIEKDNVSIKGNGASTVIQRGFDSRNYYPDEILGTVGIFSNNCCLDSITIDANKAAYSSENNRGILVNGNSNSIINCVIKDAAYECIESVQSFGLKIQGCTISGANNCGIQLVGASVELPVICGNYINGCTLGIGAGGSPVITGNALYNNEVGISASVTSSASVISGNYIYQSTNVGIGINSGEITITGNTICRSGTASISIARAANYCTISGNTLTWVTESDVPIVFERSNIDQQYAENIVIVGNIFGGKTVTDPNGSNIIENNK